MESAIFQGFLNYGALGIVAFLLWRKSEENDKQTKKDMEVLRVENKEDKKLFEKAISCFESSIREFKDMNKEMRDIKFEIKEVRDDVKEVREDVNDIVNDIKYSTK